MAEIGLGYGSEFQLMRFLGHHRNELNELIHEASKINGAIEWLDFPIDNKRISGDGEWKGITCFKDRVEKEKYEEIETKWKDFWPQSGTAMNWDGVFRIGDTWYFVEAKAHKNESYQRCGAKKQESLDKIHKAFEETQEWFQAKPSEGWIKTDCYQLANRLAFMYFCNKYDIKAKLLYVGFINGFKIRVGDDFVCLKDEVHSVAEWEEIWKEELKMLGLDKRKVAPYIVFIYPDCDPHRKKQEMRSR